MKHGMHGFVYQIEWDPVKAEANFRKHGVEFDRAAQIFNDPLALTIADEEHSYYEPRWITMGEDMAGQRLVVVHTFEQLAARLARIRLISARRPTKAELRAYEEGQ